MSTINCGSFGINSRLGIVASGAVADPINEAATALPVLRESMTFQRYRAQSRGASGSVNPIKENSREAPKIVSGGFVVEAGAVELGALAVAIAAGDSGEADKTHNDAALDILVDRDGIIAGYRHCLVQQANIRMRTDSSNPENQFMQIAASFLGIEETAGIFDAEVVPAPSPLWMANDTKVTFGGVQFPCIGFDLAIRYRIQPLYRNSLTPVCFRCLGREVRLQVEIPLHSTSVAAVATAAATMGAATIAMASTLLPVAFSALASTLSLPSAALVENAAPVSGSGEIPLTVTFQGFQSGDAGKVLTIS